MTFPLGSLRGDGADSPPARDSAAPHAPHWREQVALLVGAVAWLLALLALATHSAADSGFSTSGDGTPIHNRIGVVGAWLSDAAFFFAGYSVWWAIVVGARVWLGALARALRASAIVPPEPARTPRPAWSVWLGLALLLAASASLEWTRLYQWEAQVAGGHAGGVLGLVLGRAEFARCLPENSSLSYAIMRGLVQRLRSADRQIESLALLDVYGRVARTLLDMSEMDGEIKVIRNKVSRQDLAKVVGASREMVSRVMKDLEGRGMVQTQENGWVVIKEQLTA